MAGGMLGAVGWAFEVSGVSLAIRGIKSLSTAMMGLSENIDTQTQFESEYVQASADMAKATAGMADANKKALGPLFAYAKGMGESPQDMIKAWKDLQQVSKETQASFGKDTTQQAIALDAMSKVFEADTTDIVRGQELLQKRMKMTGDEALDLEGTVFKLAKQYNMGSEAVAGFTPMLDKVVAAYDQAGIELTSDNAKDATLSITQLAIAYQQNGMAAKEAMGAATETFGKMMEEQKQVSNMMTGLGGGPSEIATKFGMAAGDIRPFWELMNRGPAGAAQAMIGMNDALMKQKQSLVATGQQGSPQYQKVVWQLKQFDGVLQDLDPNLQNLVKSGKDVSGVLGQTTEVAKGAGKAMLDVAKDANKSTVSFDEAWERTRKSLDDTWKLMGRPMARDSMKSVSGAIREINKDMRSLKKEGGGAFSFMETLSSFSMTGLYTFIPLLDKLGVASKKDSTMVVQGLMSMQKPLESLGKMGIDVFSKGGLIAGAVGFVGALSGAFGKGAQDWAKSLLGSFATLLGKVWGWLKSNWPLMVDSIKSAFGAIWDWVKTEGVVYAWEALRWVGEAVWDGLRSLGKAMVDWAASEGPGVIESVVDVVKNAWTGLNEAWPAIETWLGESWDQVVNWAATLDWGEILLYIGKGAFWIADALGKAVTWGLNAAWTVVEKAFDATIDMIQATLYGWTGVMEGEGKKAGQGLLDGLVWAIQNSDWGRKLSDAMTQGLEFFVASITDAGTVAGKVLAYVFDPMNLLKLTSGAMDFNEYGKGLADIWKKQTAEGEMSKLMARDEARRANQERKDSQAAMDAKAIIEESHRNDMQMSTRMAESQKIMDDERRKREIAKRPHQASKRGRDVVSSAPGKDPLTTAMVESATAQRGNTVATLDLTEQVRLLARSMGGKSGGNPIPVVVQGAPAGKAASKERVQQAHGGA